MKHIFSKKNRALLGELVRTDFKLRYQGSVLGYAWTLLRPMMLFLILYVVFVKFLRIGAGVPHYPVYLLLGIVIWNFFVEMTTQSLGSIVGRGDLIRKIRIPRWIIVLSSSLSAVINLLLNMIIITVFLAINKVDIQAGIVWLPLIFVQVYIFALGLSLFLSAAYVRYRDVNYIWEVTLQGLFYLTPILYPISLITNLQLQKILFMNPMAVAIQDARYIAVTPETVTIHQVFHGGWYGYIPYVLIIIVFIVGLLFFKRESKYFAENI
jgi:ABC-2 type transport system permease protein